MYAGDECARTIGGAVKGLFVECERPWPRLYGDLFRGDRGDAEGSVVLRGEKGRD